MKKLTINLLAFVLPVLSYGVTYNVTVPAGTKACYIAGEMNSWSQQVMTKVNETHYTLDIASATTAHKYKYCSGPSWSYEELNADGSGVANRSYTSADVVAKWASVWEPALTIAQITNNLSVSYGNVTRYSFNSTFIGNRTIDVWLPANYSTSKKYSVLYMHDGQMLFDATKTWNGQEWKVDETISQLLTSNQIKDIIVVGIWNSDNRYSEYYPKKSMDYLSDNVKNTVMSNVSNDPKADKYLSFIVTELKPYIDKTYSVNTDLANTYIAGSSMGGLISWYALCEYPDVFGSAICMSTHWADNTVDSPEIPYSFRKYLLNKLPSSSNHKIYFDHGTVDLDANYGVHQVLVDTIMKHKGYSSTNWESLVFDGEGHNETAWANRFNIPLKFLLKLNLSNPTLSLTTNFAKQSYECKTNVSINWSSNLVDNVKIEFSGDNGATWQTIAASVTAISGTYNWTTPTTALYECKIRISDVSNSLLSATSTGIFVVYNHLPDKVEPLLRLYYPVFTYPYNTFYPVTTSSDSEYINGKVGNACGPTAVSNIMAYWEFPRQGFGSRTFVDSSNCTWSANFSATNYNYDLLTDKLTINSPQSVIDANATLVYHAGVAMHDTWRSGNSSGVLNAFKQYFGFSSKAKQLNRDDYTPQQWEKVMKSELSLGRPQIMEGWSKINSDGSHEGHWFMCDGYSADNQFHVSLDYGAGSQNYYPLYEFDVYKLKNWIFAYLEPEKNGKDITLTLPAGGENWKQKTIKNIQWTSTGVSNVNIEFSDNGGESWTILASNIVASTGNYDITLPEVVSSTCKIRVSDVSDLNIYSRNRTNFSVYNTKTLQITSSFASSVQSGVILPIRWSSKGISNIVIEYSINNGQSWNSITEKNADDFVYKWTVPNITASNCKIRITDTSDNSLNSETSTFAITSNAVIGGPYATDANTLALYHFDYEYSNTASSQVFATPFNFSNFIPNDENKMDYTLRIDNSNSSVSSCVVLPHENPLSLTGDWTIEFWFKINSWGGTSTAYPYLFIKSGANYFVFLDVAAKTLHVGYDYNGGAETLYLPDNSLEINKWYHILYTRNTSNSTLNCILHDMNRQELISKSVSYNPLHTPKITSDPINIGGYSGGSNVQFDGYIDEVRISNVVRTFVGTGINNIKNDPIFSVYPNPTDGIIHLNIVKSISNGLIKITSISGQEVYNQNIRDIKNNTISLFYLNKGVYFIHISNQNNSWTEKVILK